MEVHRQEGLHRVLGEAGQWRGADEAYQDEPLVVYIDGEKRYTAGKPGAKSPNCLKQDWMKARQTLEFSFSAPSRTGYMIDEVKVWTTDKRAFEE